ncbi:MAG: radical SAM family heme chaperone HemW, partial [Cyanobacteria bacterium P01_H01_bin.74]
MHTYIHIPFCESRCIYCDFTVRLNKYGGYEDYLSALSREIDSRFATIEACDFPDGINTLYFGGGTPALVSADNYQRLLKQISKYLPLSKSAEITIEANPTALKNETARSKLLKQFQDYLMVGFNRISIGVQSFENPQLKALSRIHSAEEAIAFIQLCQSVGWENISIDLMYAVPPYSTPEESVQRWENTIETAIDLNVQHISAYGLKVEENTPLARLSALSEKKESSKVRHTAAQYNLPPDEVNVSLYELACQRLTAAGYIQYEFSNFAKPGYVSKHNLAYWDTKDVLALGVSAHGYWKGQRYVNTADFEAYCENPLSQDSYHDSKNERIENALIFGLRKLAGVNITDLEKKYHFDFW